VNVKRFLMGQIFSALLCIGWVAACSTSKTTVGGDTDMPIAAPQAIAAASRAEGHAEAANPDAISQCKRRLGTIAITESDINAQALQSAGLPRSVAPLVRYLLTSSKCFTVVDRGAAFALMERERAMYDARTMAWPEGRRKLKTVDYVMRAEVVFAEQTKGAKGLLGGMFGSTFGAFGSAYSHKEAVVLLSVVDAASSEIIHATFGHGYSDAVGLGNLAFGKEEFLVDGGWSDTPQAKTVAAALLDAWNHTMIKLQELPAAPTPEMKSAMPSPPVPASAPEK
jgi:curli biogenesis system outer membrane secretion channel CsgG